MRSVFDVKTGREKLKIFEAEQSKPGFWDDKEKATAAEKEFADAKKEIEKADFLRKELNDLMELAELDLDDDMEKELKERIERFEEIIGKEEIRAFLSGKYDKKNAVLQIFAGAGGRDAQDWAAMLLKMYEKYLSFKGFKIDIIEQSYGEEGGPDGRIGIKEATLEVKGSRAFGMLKAERGVHRLVRISPFSSKRLRHTSFAMVDVLPEMKEKSENLEINPEDLKIDTYKASGPGGQNVNKRETAIRITHIPTGIIASSQSDRQQGLNKEKAMKILMSKLVRLEEEKKEKEINKVKGDKVSVGWGNQIRSYVLHPYKMVKDLRTGIETSNVEEVLNGDLDEFIESGIREYAEKK